MTRRTVLLGLITVLTTTAPARPDALVVTRAMTASTIAEAFVEPDEIRVELEIGAADVEAFQNLMPDEIYERLGHPPSPWPERLDRFLTEDWVINANGEPLPGRLEAIEARPRIERDDITGDPLPAPAPADDDDPEIVVAARLVYPLASPPSTLTFSPPKPTGTTSTASVGFVVYHAGLPVNDFRYLGQEETLDLDWQDPWFSRFHNRNLKRQFDAPLSAFLYVDHFEVRKEIIVRPKDLQSWFDLDLPDADVIRVAEQTALKERVAEFLHDKNPVLIDGAVIEPVLDRIHFVRRTLRQTGIVDPPEDLPMTSATLGVIFAYPVSELPQFVTMEWELFTDRIAAVPVVATDEAGGLPSTVTPDDRVLEWTNFLKNPSVPSLVDLAPPPARRRGQILLFIALTLLVTMAALAAYTGIRTSKRGALLVGLALLVAAVALWPMARPGRAASVDSADADAAAHGLLSNVYRAFDFREESAIYDALERSVAGELLTETYLETRAALELQNQGGARVKVDDVEMLASDVSRLPDVAGFKSTCTWNVSGSVGHWGHIHRRRNQYRAVLTVEPVNGSWKITGLELLSEERL